MRESLAPLAWRRHLFTATVGPRGASPDGPRIVLRDVRCAETGAHLAEHVWAPVPERDPRCAVRIGRRIRFRATVRPYVRGGGGGERDYHLTGLRHVEEVAAEGPGG